MAAKSPIPIWLDCDPGNDDAVAILVSLFNKHFDLVGISTVHGNTTIENTTYNALALLTAFGKNVPVYKGFGLPIKAEAKTAAHIHGVKGIGGYDLLPTPTISTVGDSSEFLRKLKKEIVKHEGELSIVAIGPLTNIAIFFEKNPDLRSRIKYLSIMGAAISEKSWKIGEFNITTDPEAGQLVLMDEILIPKTILIPSDLTHKAIATLKIQNDILCTNSKLRKLYYEIIMSFAVNYKKNKGFLDGPPVHDPLAVLALLSFYGIENELAFKFKRHGFKVILDHETDSGRVYLTEENLLSGAYVGYDIDVDQLWISILGSLDEADKTAKLNQENETE